MTKEQIIRHKEVIKWFMDNPDKGVWFKDINMGWVFTTQPSFNPYYIYVQNDEYAEFRKALADGKKLQCKLRYPNQQTKWEDFMLEKATQDFNVDLDYLRIKHKEPQFKIGDWIIHYVGDKKQVIQIIDISKSISSDLLLYYKDGCFTYNKENTKKWEPREGEWCVFWNNNKEYLIAKYNTQHNNNDFGLLELDFWYDKSSWKNIAPLEFVETLKDK